MLNEKIKLLCFFTVKLVPIFWQYLSLINYVMIFSLTSISVLRTKTIISNENIDSFLQ